MAVLRIKVNIAGRQYPLSINEEEEEAVRKAGKEINEMIREFEEKYAVSDRQDALSMVALQIASKLNLFKNSRREEDAYLSSRIEKLTSLIDENIK